MAQPEGLEIYIPLEAEVKSVLLHSLPSSVLQKMGLSEDDLKSIPDSTRCVWMSPAFVQKKGQKEALQSRCGVREQLMKVLGDHDGLRVGSAQWSMSFVTANCTAYRALKETVPVAPHRQSCSTPKVPKGALSNMEQDAVIIHHGRIYLSVKKRRKQEASVPQVSPPALTTEEKVAPEINKPLKRKHDSSQRAPGDTKDGPLPKISHCGPPVLSPSPVSIQRQMSCSDLEPKESSTEQNPSLTPYMHSLHTSTLESAQHSHIQSWLPSEPSALQQDFDYEELAHREKIALMQAKLQQSDAVLGNHEPTYK